MTPTTERMRHAVYRALSRLTKTTAGGGRISSAVAPIPARRAIRDLPVELPPVSSGIGGFF